MRDPALWDRIRLYPFAPVPEGQAPKSDPGKIALAARLEEAEGWDPAYVREAIEEYRRFVYLSRVSDRHVTPSEIVDRVWHEHITDSRSYVEDFCRTLFGEILHHEPATGPDDRPRFEAQYAATRTLYAAEFGREPPAEIWFYRPPDKVAADRRRGRLARAAGWVAGIGVAWTCHAAFGWLVGAIFVGCVAGTIVNGVLRPRIPGPRHASSNSDSSGCSGCGD